MIEHRRNEKAVLFQVSEVAEVLLDKIYGKTLRVGLCVSLTILFLSVCANAQSTISGFVYDKQRNALFEVDLELLNENYQVRGRTKTDTAGRYTFTGLIDGRYTVKAMPFRFDLEDQEFMVEVVTINIRGGQGVGFFTQDFYLQPKKGGLAETELAVVFAQDVPPAAKKSFDEAVKSLASKREAEGFDQLNEAIRLFPNYYLALHRMGKELFTAKNYEKAIPYFYNATEVNPKSATSFYYLGFAMHNLGKSYNKAATVSLEQAATLAPGSVQVLYLLGTLEREGGDFVSAEKHLLQAKRLSKVAIPAIHKELAQLYGNEMKKFKEAADELELYLSSSKLPVDEAKKIKKIIDDLRQKSKNRPSTE